LNGWHLQS